jgi:antitoxin component YwqK of YwqJK toxin-antitoxin module
MKFLPLWVACLLLVSCDDAGKDEIYNENNTNVSGGVVYNIDDQPINGLYRVYYSDGEIKMEVQSKNGKPDGIGKFYNEEGDLLYLGNFSAGLPNGAFYNYYDNEQVHNEMNYVNGLKDGAQRVFDEEGNLLVEVIFKNGQPVSGYAIVNDEKVPLSEDELSELK